MKEFFELENADESHSATLVVVISILCTILLLVNLCTTKVVLIEWQWLMIGIMAQVGVITDLVKKVSSKCIFVLMILKTALVSGTIITALMYVPETLSGSQITGFALFILYVVVILLTDLTITIMMHRNRREEA